MRTLSRILAVMAFALAGAAAADRNITVDGNNSDWITPTAVTSCFQESSGDVTGLDLTKVCVENNNASTNTGNLYALFQTNGALPTNAGSWFGIAVDLNKDGVIDDTDEVYAVSFATGTSTAPSGMQVYTAVSLVQKASYAVNKSCTTGKNAPVWSGARNIGNGVVEISIPYACIGDGGAPQVPLTFNDDNRLMSAGADLGTTPAVLDQTQYATYNGTTDSMGSTVIPVDVSNLTAVAQQGTVKLVWTNPAATQHKGALVLRGPAGVAPSAAPTNGFTYTAGSTLGNATVVVADEAGTVSSYTDTNLTNGTRYYYRVYNHAFNHTYASGNAPNSSGIYATPTDRVSPNPAWCYSTGLSLLTQPSTQLGSAVFTGGGQAAVSANKTLTGDPTNDGTELFRPVALQGSVQSRFPLVSLIGPSGTAQNMIVVGDSSGRAYAINPATGAFLWASGSAGVNVGGALVASPSVQLRSSNATFGAVNPGRDLIYFATSTGSPATNQVVALSSANGSVVWTYKPGDLGDVSGGMLVDTVNNRLWVATNANGATPTVRVLNTAVTGTNPAGQLVASFPSLGGITTSVTRDYGVSTSDPSDDQVLVANTSGTVYGLNLNASGSGSLALWSLPLGSGLSSYPFPIGGGFIASVKGANQVAWYWVSGTTVTQAWTQTIAGPSGIRIDYPTQKIFVGSSDGNLYQLNVGTGAIEKTVSLGSQVGMPTIDTTANRLHVGTSDGRLCAFQLPLP